MTRVSNPAALAAVAAALLAAAPAAAVTTTTIIGVADESGLGPDGAFGWASGAPAGGDAFVDGAHLGPGGFPSVVSTGQGEADVRVDQIDAATVDYTFFFGPGSGSGRVSSFVQFVGSSATSLWLMDYQGFEQPTERSLLVFERRGEAGVESLTDDFETCYMAAPGAFGADWCDVIDADPAPVELFSDLAGGVYRLGIFDGSLPERGMATFRVASAPVPTGAMLLFGAFGLWQAASHSVRRRAR